MIMEFHLIYYKDHLLKNIRTLELYLYHSGDTNKKSFALNLIKKGICFVAYKKDGEIRFAPSRFIGYLNNDMEMHEENENKNGCDTNPAINEILGFSPIKDIEMENAYLDYCKKLCIKFGDKGSFGRERKFWRMF